MTIIRNIEAIAQVTGQGVIEGQTYNIVKAVIKDVDGWGVESAAWVRLEDGSAITVKNAHIIFGL